MEKTLKQMYVWASSQSAVQPPDDLYCPTRDVFQARLDMLRILLERDARRKDTSSLIIAVVGEIGNNSFDHNIGNWRDIPGVYFCYDLEHGMIGCADRGQGIRATLQRVRPGIPSDTDALHIAFTETISGRAPEKRGNGLKFVRSVVSAQRWHLEVVSGDARAVINEQFVIKPSVSSVYGCIASLRF